MWIFTPGGFVSAVVRPENPSELAIRARDRESLEELAEEAGVEIIKTPHGDYPMRIFVTHEFFADWVARKVFEIDYGNFKSRAHRERPDKYSAALHDVWSAMLATENEPRS